MQDPTQLERFAHLVEPRDVPVVDVAGPTIQFLTPPGDADGTPCLMRGTIPPGMVIPLHSHSDPEIFIGISGEVEGFTRSADGDGWLRIGPNAVFHVPGGAPHAFRNRSGRPAVQFVISTSRLARFFLEVGEQIGAERRSHAPQVHESPGRLLEIAARYGYWNATPEENARIGLPLPSPS